MLQRPVTSARSLWEAPKLPSHWVEPRLVAEVRYAEWTSEGSLRHPAFLGLREDKAAREVVRKGIGRGVG